MMNIGPEKIVIRFKRIILQCITHLSQAGLDDEFHVWFFHMSFGGPSKEYCSTFQLILCCICFSDTDTKWILSLMEYV